MLYDYIIIGAGISGLYAAYNIKKIDPSKTILILDKNKIVGGRMNVYNFCGTTVNAGAGIGRKKKDYLLIKLLDELNIKYVTVKSIINRHENIKKINFTGIIKMLKTKYDKEKYGTYTFKKFAIEILGKEEYNDLVAYIGYTDFESEDAYETLYNYGLDDVISNNEILYIKWQELLDSLVNKIGSGNIKVNNNIISINKSNDQYIIKNDKNKVYNSNKLIIATTIDTVKHLLPKLSIYNNIKGQNFLRVYGKFDDKSTVIVNNIINSYTIVSGPIKKIIPINRDNGIYMIVYTDNKGADYFSDNLDDKQFFSNEIEKTLNLQKNTLKLTAIKSFYWDIGTHYFKPLNKKYKDRKEFINKSQTPDKNLFVIGEMISRNQGWVQGALESVNNILNKL